MTKDEALKLALEALEQLQGGCTDSDDGTIEAITVWCPEVINAIKEALAQPEQEPDDLTIAYMSGFFNGKKKREWVGLTEEDLSVCDEDGVILARYWEAKLREKNGC